VLADADESNAGIASGVNNAIARVASLIAIAGVGAIVAASFGSKLEDQLGNQAARNAQIAAAVDDAKRQPLAEVMVPGLPPGEQAELTEASQAASISAFHVGIAISTGLVALGGVLGLVGIVNPRRRVEAEDCPGGQLVGVSSEAARQSPCDWDAAISPSG
jgi:hypothetical protein